MSKKDQAFALFDQGKRPGDQEVKNLGLKPKTTYNYYQGWKKSGGTTGAEEKEGKQALATVTAKGVKDGLPTTDALSQTSYLQLVPHVQQLALTPDIFMSYMCALKNGYQGTISDWLSLVSRDFWLGRGRNFYQEVTGISEEP